MLLLLQHHSCVSVSSCWLLGIYLHLKLNVFHCSRVKLLLIRLKLFEISKVRDRFTNIVFLVTYATFPRFT